jgi:Fe2+ transport system protein FeoA
MLERMSLDRLPRLRLARVVEVDAGHPAGERLLALGLLPGTEVTLLGVAPLGDPLSLRAGKLRVAVRRKDAVCVSVALEPVATPR